MSDDVPVICRLDVEQLRGYGAGCLVAAEMVEQFANRLRSGATSLDAAVIGLEQLQQRLDEHAQMATAMVANTEAEQAEDQADATEAAPMPKPTRPPPAPDAAPPDSGSPVYTSERLVLMRELWPTTTPRQAILEQLNALPGIPISSVDALKAQARKLNLVGPHRAARVSAAQTPPHAGGIIDPRDPLPRILPDVGFPAALLPPVPQMEPLSAEDEAEAQQMLASGQHGASSLAEYFGGPLAWWQDWCKQQRAAS